MDIRVQKGPKQEGNGWIIITRMPVAIWWMPVQENPGDTEVTRAWQVISAIHNFIATHKDKDGDIDFWVNQKTGKLEVDDVKVHKVPVQEDGVWRRCPATPLI